IRSDARARAAHFDIATGALYYVPSSSLEVARFDAPNAKRLNQFWKSKQFVLPNPDNFGAIRIDSDDTLSGKEIDDAEALVASIKAANEARIAAGPVGGEVAGAPINAYTVAGDSLTPMPDVDVPIVSVGVIADGRVVATVIRSNRPVRLPAGFTARTWE
ncbi:hypothetical protein, partial [Aerococcus mictus]|uniref:hypothetical protein n=1 Tax=Aerococcus mictus TaxID=2976810 RepID=UPI001C662369